MCVCTNMYRYIYIYIYIYVKQTYAYLLFAYCSTPHNNRKQQQTAHDNAVFCLVGFLLFLRICNIYDLEWWLNTSGSAGARLRTPSSETPRVWGTAATGTGTRMGPEHDRFGSSACPLIPLYSVSATVAVTADSKP